MTVLTRETFMRRCDAADELSALGYAEESGTLWRSAFSPLTALEPALADSVRQLLAQESIDSDRARELAARCAGQLPAEAPRTRWSLVAGAALFAIATSWLLGLLNRPIVMSSLDYSPEFTAPFVADGDETTEWLLPSGALGHVDFALSRRRTVHEVVLTNGHNRHYLDRGVRKARVVLYDDDIEVDSAEVNFAKIAAEPSRQSVELAGKQGTRVRVYVLEFHGLGSALAEVEID